LEVQAINSNNSYASAVFGKFLEDFRNKGVGKGLNIWNVSPDFTLENATGKWITLSEDLIKGPIIFISTEENGIVRSFGNRDVTIIEKPRMH
jgi:hypothetical protein